MNSDKPGSGPADDPKDVGGERTEKSGDDLAHGSVPATGNPGVGNETGKYED